MYICRKQKSLQEDVNPTSVLTSGAINKQMSIARRLAVEHTFATNGEDAHERRKERALQRLPRTRVFTYQMLFTDRTPKRKARHRQQSALAANPSATPGMHEMVWFILLNFLRYLFVSLLGHMVFVYFLTSLGGMAAAMLEIVLLVNCSECVCVYAFS
jgi:hypothetical protein